MKHFVGDGEAVQRFNEGVATPNQQYFRNFFQCFQLLVFVR